MRNLQRALRAGNGNVIHFSKIVIVGGEPEHWDCINTGSSGLFRKLDRRKRFVNGEHRTAEKADLLSRDNRGRTFAQAIEVGQRFWRSVPGLILALKDARYAFTAGRVVGNLRGLIFYPLAEKRSLG